MNHLLHRRSFLQRSVTGLSSIALASLLKDDGLLANESPIRPAIDPARPYAPRPPHFAPKAKQVLMIFCSGALSHVDTWDYKPALFKRHDTPMPGAGGLITGVAWLDRSDAICSPVLGSCADGSVRVWDTRDGRSIFEFAPFAHGDTVACSADASGQSIAVSGTSGEAGVWNIRAWDAWAKSGVGLR